MGDRDRALTALAARALRAETEYADAVAAALRWLGSEELLGDGGPRAAAIAGLTAALCDPEVPLERMFPAR